MIYKIIKRARYEALEVKECSHTFPAHIHKRLRVGEVNSGEKYITIGSKTTRYAKGDMFIIPPFVARSCRAKTKTNYAILSISDGDLIDRDELLSDLKRVNIDPKRVIELIGVRDRKLNVGDLMSDLLVYIDEESVNGLTIAQIAKKAGYSADHISRPFKNAIGISPRQYVIQERIRKSKRRAKDELISEIAQYSGFYDQSHFIRHFKRYEGVTPKEYYRSLR